MLHLMNETKKLCDTNLIWSTYLKRIDPKVQDWIGREFLISAPLGYKIV